MNYKNLYQQQLLEHYHNPQNKGKLDAPDVSSGVYNPSCGDSVVIEAIVEGGKIKKILFEGKGCVISQAAASLLTQLVAGKGIEHVMDLDVEDMKKLVGIELGPTRLRCAMLPLEALQNGIKQFRAKDGTDA